MAITIKTGARFFGGFRLWTSERNESKGRMVARRRGYIPHRRRALGAGRGRPVVRNEKTAGSAEKGDQRNLQPSLVLPMMVPSGSSIMVGRWRWCGGGGTFRARSHHPGSLRCPELEVRGAKVIGPIGNLGAAQDQASRDDFDVAVINVKLGNKLAWSVADQLMQEKIPFGSSLVTEQARFPNAFST
jgi:hypothetical protein